MTTDRSTNNELVPITPQKATERYIEEREEDASYDTIRTNKYALKLFIEWCESEGIENLNSINGRLLADFKSYCKSHTEKNKVSLNGTLSVLRRFMIKCVDIEAVSPNVPDKVPIPKMVDDEDVCYDKPSKEEVRQTLEYLEKHEPASRRHVEYAIIEEVGNRVGSLRGIDIEDINLEKKVIKLRHRPHKDNGDVKGTPLKNGNDGERHINMSDDLADLIQQYINSPDRPDVIDRFNREPLLTTKDGRISVTTIRRDLYKLTRPCEYTNTCPHDKDIETCKAAENEHASECPSSYSPHPLRRFSIEGQIDQGVPKDELADRVDVSVPVLNKHYDKRTKERRRKERLSTLEKLFEGYGDSSETLTESELKSIIDENGMIDPVALKQLTNDLHETNPESSDTDTTSDAENDQCEDQLSIEDFVENSTAISQPALLPVIGGLAAGQWVPDRLHRELSDMTPTSEDSIQPSADRAAKGIAAYACYIFMVAVNLTLAGILPV